MTAVRMKRAYGPTLGQMLAPRWRATSSVVRGLVIATGVALAVAAVALVLTLESAHFSHGGRVRFSFDYRGLYRTAPDVGGYVKVQSRGADGALRYSYAVDPVRLPPYTDSLSGELPLYASGYIRDLERRYRSFELRGEGKTRINNKLTGYEVLYTAELEGREVFGRDVLLLPDRAGARDGVAIVMLMAPSANRRIDSPEEVASKGALLEPLKSFSFG